ncbi:MULTISPECIES: hypothetical protein [unclassified Nesterenkonia]|uniref:hypothetical protein n=1 Tax=unclassified Nesterenkonia TaxID=2629769 RepID=UPI000A19BE9D|nr:MULTISPECIES: hypothetical protein [unclassified Nesterenkonia]MDS2174235.1 hypothetical protein [Nesterenkonia sp. CL21]OSM42493.1 hypothetical protein BCY76_014160 [Nesterenkonia sp. PF2B19]
MFGKKKKPSHTWEHKVLAGVETARDWSAPKLGAAADWAETTYRKNAPKVQDASARALRSVEANAAVAADRARGLASKASVGLESQYDKLPPQAKAEVDKVYAKYSDAKRQLSEDYVPAASAKLGGYADRTAKLIHKAEVDPRVEKALVKATGDKKVVKKLRKTSEKYAKQTAKALKKQQKSKSRRKGLLVFGLVAAGVTAGVAAWRASQPVEDPWKKPEPISGGTPASSSKPAAQAETNADATPQASSSAAPSAKPSAADASTSGAKPAQPAESVTKDGEKGASASGGVPQPKPAT